MNGLPKRKSLREVIVNQLFMGGGKIIRFLEVMRKCSYYRHSLKSKYSINTLKFLYYRRLYNLMSIKLGMSITYDSLGYGVVIPHHGTIVVGPNTIGNYAVLFPCTNITGNHKIIGDGLFLSTGAKITTKVVMGENVTVAANSVVTKDCGSNVMLAGMPAAVKKEYYPAWYDRDGVSYRVDYIEKRRRELGL